MIEEKARLIVKTFNLELLLYVCWKTSSKARHKFCGRSLRGWYKTMFEGEEFDEEAWAIEREGIASPEEPKGSRHSQHQRGRE